MEETREPRDLSHHNAVETSSAPTTVAEASGLTPQAANSGQKTTFARSMLSLLERCARATTSQDFIGVLVAIVVLALAIGALHPDFLVPGQLMDVLNQASFVAVLACGMAFLLAMRELDLSVGSTYGLTSLCAAMLMHTGVPSWLGVLAGLALGAMLGLTNGLLIQLLRLPSIVATLATLSIYRGLIYALSNGKQVIGLSLSDPYANLIGGHPLGIPTTVWVMILVIVILLVVLHTTPFGYRVRSIGSNPEAALFSGLPIVSVRLFAFALMGLLGGVAGMLSLGYFGSSDPNLGTGYELYAIAAAVIGGTPLRGGKATIVGAALGAILLSIVNSGLAYFNVSINWTAFATGVVILLAVSLDSMLRHRRTERGPSL
jgi:ribose transport system permease protein